MAPHPGVYEQHLLDSMDYFKEGGGDDDEEEVREVNLSKNINIFLNFNLFHIVPLLNCFQSVPISS